MRYNTTVASTRDVSPVALRSDNASPRNRYLLMALLHVLYGVAILSVRSLHPAVFYAVVLIAVVRTLRARNADEEAAMWSMYLVGVEIVNRMIGGVNHEMTKYIIIGLLILAMIAEKGTARRIPFRFVAYIVLLLPSVLIVDVYDVERYRQLISANLSGPVLLGVAALYFHDRKYSLMQLRKFLGFALYPMLTAVTIIRIRGPISDAIEISYMSSSSLFTGGAGSNQVSAMLGYGIVVVALGVLLMRGVTRYRYLDYALIALFLLQALLTFSRGGVYSAAMAVVFGIMVALVKQKRVVGRVKVALTAIMIVVLSVIVFEYINDITGSSLERRYQGETGTAGKRNIATGREKIFLTDLRIFSENIILGTGPGMATVYRVKYYGQAAASHVELTRLLAEHGMLGVFCVLIVYGSAFVLLLRVRRSRTMLIWAGMLVILGLATTFHNATRLAMPMFVYGLAFIRITDDVMKTPEA